MVSFNTQGLLMNNHGGTERTEKMFDVRCVIVDDV